MGGKLRIFPQNSTRGQPQAANWCPTTVEKSLRYGLTQMEKSELVLIPVVGPRTGVMTPNTLASFTACPASFPAGALVGLAAGLLALTSVFAQCT